MLTVDVTDPAAVTAMVTRTRVVLTTVGPYLRHGQALVQACAEAGSPVRWEPAPDADELFPHFYGPLPWAAITARLPARFEGGELRVEGLPT